MKRLLSLTMFALMFGALVSPAYAGTEQQVPNGCEDAYYSGKYKVVFAVPGVTTNGGSGSQLIIGTDGDDVIYAGSGNDIVCGGGGYDRIFGGSGGDILNGNGHYDDLYGESGSDQLFGNASNTDPGGTGDIAEGGSGSDNLDGGAGTGDVCVGNSGSDNFTNRCETVVD